MTKRWKNDILPGFHGNQALISLSIFLEIPLPSNFHKVQYYCSWLITLVQSNSLILVLDFLCEHCHVDILQRLSFKWPWWSHHGESSEILYLTKRALSIPVAYQIWKSGSKYNDYIGWTIIAIEQKIKLMDKLAEWAINTLRCLSSAYKLVDIAMPLPYLPMFRKCFACVSWLLGRQEVTILVDLKQTFPVDIMQTFFISFSSSLMPGNDQLNWLGYCGDILYPWHFTFLGKR